MANSTKKLVLSDAAKDDLENIFEFGFYTFGEAQALRYLDSFDETFSMLQGNPLLSKPREEIQVNLRSFLHQSHAVFYDYTKTKLRIIRVLHHSRDVPKAVNT